MRGGEALLFFFRISSVLLDLLSGECSILICKRKKITKQEALLRRQKVITHEARPVITPADGKKQALDP